MDSKEKINKFTEELNQIVNNDIRKLAMHLVSLLPDYFFEIPASSTGKYHPNYSQGSGGLFRHTRALIRIAVELFRLAWWDKVFGSDAKDLIIVSLLVHDGWKQGEGGNKHTVFSHPIVAAEKILDKSNLDFGKAEWLEFIAACISSHMGQWNVDSYGDEEASLPLPQTPAQKFVHLCDYLGSRKCIEINFDAPMKR